MPDPWIAFNVDSVTDASVIGVVEGVSANSIEVAITREAPHGTGLYEGDIHRFPRLNGLVVLPSERGSVLAIVTWVGADSEDFDGPQTDRIGLPSPRRQLRAQPLGVLMRERPTAEASSETVHLDRGVLLFPTVGDPVRLPTASEARAIISPPSSDLAVHVGRAPLAANAAVMLDPSRLFGRHLAVLGNTGSGKSCSVAQLIRSSVESAGDQLNGFRAIVLDLNGEYADCFDELGENVEVVRLGIPLDLSERRLRVPYWLWDYREWLCFSDATAKSQAPLLRRCLHLLRMSNLAGVPNGVVHLVAARRVLRRYAAGAVEGDSHNKECLSVLDYALDAIDVIAVQLDDEHSLDDLKSNLTDVLAPRRGSGYKWAYSPELVSLDECKRLTDALTDAIEMIGLPEFLSDDVNVDSPRPFDADVLLDLLPLMAAEAGPDAVGWVAPMVDRLRIAMADQRLRVVAGWEPDEDLVALLEGLFGGPSENRITVLDLSLVPTHVLHVVVAVLGRVLLEALERHRRENEGEQLPTLLVVEEAHTVIRRHLGQATEEQTVSAARLCRESFERIAREGRKFGLSLVISSQRPSEVSETVLSQCNTFMIHRIVNDQDQHLVRRLMPDSLGALVDELPALPSQTALLVGWAIEIPTLVRVADLDHKFRPDSSDPDLSAAWTGQGSPSSWEAVAEGWGGRHDAEESSAVDPTDGGDQS